MTSLWLQSLLITCHLICVAIATKTLYIGGLFDFNANDAQRIISASQAAIQEIKSNLFLPGYNLELLVNDTREYDFTSASGVYNYLNSGPKKIMLLGPADNDIAKAIAHHAGAPSYGVLQFSYGTNDLYLSNYRGLYPYFFRTSISMATFDDLRIAFLKFYGWTEIGIVYGDSINEAKLSNNLKTRIESQSSTKVIAEIRLQANDPERAVRTIQDKNIHVIIGLFPLDIAARRLFCQAHRHGLYGPHYIWILQMARNNGWWNPRPGEDIGGCQSIEMTCQIRNYFSVKPANEDYESSNIFSHSKKDTSTVKNNLRSEGNVTTVDDVMMYAYDAVWSIAHVLKNSNGTLGKPLENVTYGDTSATRVFYREALKLDFGSPKLEKVRFYENGDRKFDINPVSEDAGTYSLTSGLYTEGKVSWPANTPYKTITETRDTRYIHRALFGAMIFLACLGILYALVCFIVVVVFRKQSIIWNSSPIINIIIILGCILNYITIILYAYDWTTTANTASFCRARAWTFAIGFTLSVGGLVAKLWIAYCVLSERFVRRWRNILIWMLAIILFLFILDLIIMGCWEGLDPLYATMETYKEQEEYKCFQPITDKTFNAYYYTVEHCTCRTPLAWLLIILILKFLVVIFGVFLAWQTRKLYIKSLNDTQYCAFCLFVVFFFVVFGVLIALLTTGFPNVFFSIVGIFLFLCTTIILGLLFIHKLARVVCKPRRGKRILVTGADSDTESTSSAKNCSCCGLSGACCIACCGCFPCCNMFLCCRSCCLGSKIHPSESSSDDKTEFYIAGHAQDKEGQIAYLLRKIHERDEELARLRPKHTCTSMWTQTNEDDMEEYLKREDGDGSSMESDNSEGSLDSSGKRRKRKPNKFKIYNHGADYSHVQSKVDTGVTKSPAKSPKTKRAHDEKYYLGVWKSNGGKPSDEEIAKLRAQLKERDKEIEKLRNEKEVQTSVVIHQPNSLSNKVEIVNEQTPDTHEKQCQTDDSLLYIEQSPRDKPNEVVVVMETPVKKEESPREKPNDVIVVMETPVKTKSSPSKKPAKGKKNAKTEPKENVTVVEVKSKKKKKKKEAEPVVKSPDEWLFGKSDDGKEKQVEKKDVNVIVVAQTAVEEEKKDEPVIEEDKKTTVVFIRPEEPQKKEEDKRQNHDGSVTNVIIVRPDDAQGNEENKDDEEKKKKEEDETREEEKRREEEQRIEEKRQDEIRKEEEKRKEDEKRKEEEKQKEEEKRKLEERLKEEEERKEEEKRKEDEKRKEEKQKEEERLEEEKRKEQELKEEEERKRKEEQERKQEEERKRQEEEMKKEEEEREKERKEQEEKQKEEEKKIDKPNEDIDDEETIPIRPPQNTPASVDGPQEEDNKKDDQKNKDDAIEEEGDREPEKDDDDNEREGGDDKDDDKVNGNDDKDDDKDDNENEDYDDYDASGTDDGDGDDNDNDTKNEEAPSDQKGDKEDKKNSTKPKRKPKKPIGGKLNWNAASKIDTSSGYKKKPRSKIKSYKVDYSHVKSKYSYGVTKKDQDEKKEKEEKEKEKKKKASIKGKRWNPNSTNTKK